MHNSLKNKGIYLALATAFISGFSVFFNKFALSFWSDSSIFTTAKNLSVAILFLSIMAILKKHKELKKLSKKQLLMLVSIGLVGGSIPFLLFFKGLSLSSSSGAAFIHKTLFVWIALLAVPVLKEKISWVQFFGLAILFAGVYLFSAPNEIRFGYGEMLVFLATFLWAIESIIAKVVLKTVSPITVACGRMFFGSLFLLVFICVTGGIGELLYFSTAKISWLIFGSLMLFGYVITWYKALKLAPATIVSSILVIAAPITAVLNSVFVSHTFNKALVLPVALIAVGIVLFVKSAKIANSFKKTGGLLWTGS